MPAMQAMPPVKAPKATGPIPTMETSIIRSIMVSIFKASPNSQSRKEGMLDQEGVSRNRGLKRTHSTLVMGGVMDLTFIITIFRIGKRSHIAEIFFEMMMKTK